MSQVTVAGELIHDRWCACNECLQLTTLLLASAALLPQLLQPAGYQKSPSTHVSTTNGGKVLWLASH